MLPSIYVGVLLAPTHINHSRTQDAQRSRQLTTHKTPAVVRVRKWVDAENSVYFALMLVRATVYPVVGHNLRRAQAIQSETTRWSYVHWNVRACASGVDWGIPHSTPRYIYVL